MTGHERGRVTNVLSLQSTLLRLLLRLYNVDGGRICVDGTDIACVTLVRRLSWQTLCSCRIAAQRMSSLLTLDPQPDRDVLVDRDQRDTKTIPTLLIALSPRHQRAAHAQQLKGA